LDRRALRIFQHPVLFCVFSHQKGFASVCTFDRIALHLLPNNLSADTC
jgi:hypothetical protein